MASTTRVELVPGWEKKLLNLSVVKTKVNDKATEIYLNAQAMSAGFKSEPGINYKTGKPQGGTPAKYGMKRARSYNDGPVALVYTANYAAQKDTYKNNTLLKAIR